MVVENIFSDGETHRLVCSLFRDNKNRKIRKRCFYCYAKIRQLKGFNLNKETVLILLNVLLLQEVQQLPMKQEKLQHIAWTVQIHHLCALTALENINNKNVVSGKQKKNTFKDEHKYYLFFSCT